MAKKPHSQAYKARVRRLQEARGGSYTQALRYEDHQEEGRRLLRHLLALPRVKALLLPTPTVEHLFFIPSSHPLYEEGPLRRGIPEEGLLPLTPQEEEAIASLLESSKRPRGEDFWILLPSETSLPWPLVLTIREGGFLSLRRLPTQDSLPLAPLSPKALPWNHEGTGLVLVVGGCATGKTTQAHRLAEGYRRGGRRVLTVAEQPEVLLEGEEAPHLFTPTFTPSSPRQRELLRRSFARALASSPVVVVDEVRRGEEALFAAEASRETLVVATVHGITASQGRLRMRSLLQQGLAQKGQKDLPSVPLLGIIATQRDASGARGITLEAGGEIPLSPAGL